MSGHECPKCGRISQINEHLDSDDKVVSVHFRCRQCKYNWTPKSGRKPKKKGGE